MSLRFPPEITISSGINTGPPVTFVSPSPGSSSFGYDGPSSSWPSAEPTSLAGLTGSDAPTFFSNKGAIAGVFTALGLLLISLCAVIYIGWIHRRRKQAKQSPVETVLDFKTNPDPLYPYLGSDPPKESSVRPTSSSRSISLASIAEWWARRKGGRRSSQFRDLFYRSRSPTLAEKDDVGEEDQWTLGKVLEDQHQHQVIAQPAPTARRSSRFIEVPTALGSPLPDGRGSGGKRYTLEDAMLPSSSPAPYDIGGRHPYAQG